MYRWQTILLEEHTYSGVLPHTKTFTGAKDESYLLEPLLKKLNCAKNMFNVN
jgi:hypothetical protein